MTASTTPAIRVLLFGFGLAGRVFHAPLVTSVDEMSLDAIVTSDAERVAQARAAVPGAAIIATSDAALERAADFDLAIIAGANVTHLPLSLACLERGLHVVIDKPVAPDAESARRIADAAAAAGRQVFPFQNRRWDSDYLTLRAALASQPIGAVHRLESRIERMRPALKGGWRESTAPEAMGGVLLDFGAHLVDQAIELLGPVWAVHAEARSTRFPGTSDDDAQFTLRHVNGAVSYLVGSQAAAFAGPRFTALGTSGGVRIQGSDTQEDALKSGRRPVDGEWGIEAADFFAEVRVMDGTGAPVDTHLPMQAGHWDAYYPGVASAIREQGPAPVPFVDAIANMRVLDAAAQSALTGEQVILDPPAEHVG